MTNGRERCEVQTIMRSRRSSLLVCAFLAAGSMALYAQAPGVGGAAGSPRGPSGLIGAVDGAKFTTQYIRLGQQGEGLLYRPVTATSKARIGVVFTHPGDDNFYAPIGRELASRGYVVLMVNYRGNGTVSNDYRLPTLSLGVAYLRGLPGVRKVVVSGHSGGAHEMALYEDVAENGVGACNGPEKVYACRAPGLDHLQKPDGLILLDPPLGNFHAMSSLDPAVSTDVKVRTPSLDMFAAANGFDAATGRAHYSPEFAKRFYAAQSERNAQVLSHALERLKAVEAGKGEFANDEALVIPGLGVEASGARLFQPDTQFAAHSKHAHLLLKGDGSRETTIIYSIRPPQAQSARQLQVLGATSTETTVRGYLSHGALRTPADYAITADDITGVDWRSAFDSPPGNAYGIKVPTLILTMSCHYLVVPGELIYDRLAATDKTYAAVEGAMHTFTACKPEYGDTSKRTFDFVDEWLNAENRF